MDADLSLSRSAELEAKFDDLNRAYDAQVNVVRAQQDRDHRLEAARKSSAPS